MKAKWRNSPWVWGVLLIALFAVVIPVIVGHGGESPWEVNTWQQMASPGDLSSAHASLRHDCAACHTPVHGVDANKCILCHANNETLLQRQPTAFHADVGDCRQCHIEHRGKSQRPTDMDHIALARLGLKRLADGADSDAENRLLADRLKSWTRDRQWVLNSLETNPRLHPEEAVLNCAACHGNDDQHFDLFGKNCAACHDATRWSIPEFRHPPSTSMDCAQCHQAPPSHYMMHFKMISQRVAGQPHARVDQCYLCHQTTSWPDIKRVGWYKHH